MIIDLKSILHSTRFYDYHLEKGWWKSGKQDEDIYGLESPLEVKVKIYKTGDRFILEGKILGNFRVGCHKCLESYVLHIYRDFKVYFIQSSEDTDKSEIELFEEDMEIEHIRGEEIDLNTTIREQIYLALPIQLLCEKKCRGLCPECGVNLNKTTCSCEQEKGHPGFLKLKEFKIQGE